MIIQNDGTGSGDGTVGAEMRVRQYPPVNFPSLNNPKVNSRTMNTRRNHYQS